MPNEYYFYAHNFKSLKYLNSLNQKLLKKFFNAHKFISIKVFKIWYSLNFLIFLRCPLAAALAADAHPLVEYPLENKSFQWALSGDGQSLFFSSPQIIVAIVIGPWVSKPCWEICCKMVSTTIIAIDYLYYIWHVQ